MVIIDLTNDSDDDEIRTKDNYDQEVVLDLRIRKKRTAEDVGSGGFRKNRRNLVVLRYLKKETHLLRI